MRCVSVARQQQQWRCLLSSAMKAQIAVWLVWVAAVSPQLLPPQLLPPLRRGRIFNFRAWSGKPGPYFKRHPIPIRLYSAPPRQLVYFLPAQPYSYGQATAATTRPPQPQHSSYETVPYVYPPNDFEAVKGLNLSGDPFLKSNFETSSGIDALPLEPFSSYESSVSTQYSTGNRNSQSVKVDSVIIPSSIFAPGQEVSNFQTFSEHSSSNLADETFVKNSAVSPQNMYAALPVQAVEIDPIVTDETDSSVTSTDDPPVEADIVLSTEAEEETVTPAAPDSEVAEVVSLSAVAEVGPMPYAATQSGPAAHAFPHATAIQIPRDETVPGNRILNDFQQQIFFDPDVTPRDVTEASPATSGLDGAWDAGAVSPGVVGSVASGVSLVPHAGRRKPLTAPTVARDALRSNAEGHNASAATDSPAETQASNRNEDRRTGQPVHLHDRQKIVGQKGSNLNNDLTNEFTVIQRIYPTSQPAIALNGTESSLISLNKELVTTNESQLNIPETAIKVTSSSKDRESNIPTDVRNESLSLTANIATVSVNSSYNLNYNTNDVLIEPASELTEVIELLPVPPRPLVPPISTRATPTFLIKRLKEKFPHRAAFQESLASPDTSKRSQAVREGSFTPLKITTPLEGAGNTGFESPDLKDFLVRPQDLKEASKTKLTISSGGIGHLPLETHSVPESGHLTDLPGTSAGADEETVRGYRFSYSVEDDRSGSSYSRYEKSDGLHTHGQYSVLLPDGRTQVVKFFDDGLGYHADVQYI